MTDPEPEIATVEVEYAVEVRLDGDEDDHEVRTRAQSHVEAGHEVPFDIEIVERRSVP